MIKIDKWNIGDAKKNISKAFRELRKVAVAKQNFMCCMSCANAAIDQDPKYDETE